MRRAVLLFHTSPDQPHADDVVKIRRRRPVFATAFELGDAKHPIARQSPREHAPVTRLEDEKGQQGAGKEHGPRQHHDGCFFGEVDLLVNEVFHGKWERQ